MGASSPQPELQVLAELGCKQRGLHGNRRRVTRAKGAGSSAKRLFSPEGSAQARVVFSPSAGDKGMWPGSAQARCPAISTYHEDAGHQAGSQETCDWPWSCCGLGHLGPHCSHWVSDSPGVQRCWAGRWLQVLAAAGRPGTTKTQARRCMELATRDSWGCPGREELIGGDRRRARVSHPGPAPQLPAGGGGRTQARSQE